MAGGYTPAGGRGTDRPEADPALVATETIVCIVQVDGKLRDRLDVPVDVTADALRTLALASEKVRHALHGAALANVIVRPPRVVNVVSGPQ